MSGVEVEGEVEGEVEVEVEVEGEGEGKGEGEGEELSIINSFSWGACGVICSGEDGRLFASWFETDNDDDDDDGGGGGGECNTTSTVFDGDWPSDVDGGVYNGE